ncbi:hypothetical protein ACVWVZ_004917 [Pseudomonas tolaasii]
MQPLTVLLAHAAALVFTLLGIAGLALLLACLGHLIF